MRKLITVTLIVMMVLGLSGCGGNSASDNEKLVSDTATVFNARYTGYTDDVEKALNKSFNSRTADKLRESIKILSESKEKTVIDVTDLVESVPKLDLNKEFLDEAGNVVKVDPSKLIDELIEKDGDRYIIRLSSLEKGRDTVTVRIQGFEYDIDLKQYKRSFADTKGEDGYNFTATKYIFADGKNGSRKIIVTMTNEFGKSYKLGGSIDEKGKAIYSDDISIFTDCDIDIGI